MEPLQFNDTIKVTNYTLVVEAQEELKNEKFASYFGKL